MTQSPPLKIPPSPNTVSVSVIDTTAHVRIAASRFFTPDIPGNETLQACCYSFLIRHHNTANSSKYSTLVFDLGVRKDFHNGPKVLVDMVKSMPSDTLQVDKNVSTILEENDVPLNSVGGIIWSHHHFDHTGDPSTFPSSTDLIVGPGFKKAFVPAYPTVPDAAVDERAWADRELIEISFSDSNLKIGQFSAYDFYGDGSFYLLDTPGHAIGHMAGLARTSADPPEFMFLGGDIAHHGGEFRPSQYLPMPKEITLNPLQAPYASTCACPGSIFEAVHPERSSTKPFYRLATNGVHSNPTDAQKSVDDMQEFDAAENVLIAISHDRSLYDLWEYFPQEANGWSKKSWKGESRWRFLRDFDVVEG